MTEFAKLFQSEKYGQLVVMRDTDDDGKPAVMLYTHPGNGLAVCCVNLAFADTDEGEALADKAFANFDIQAGERIARDVFEQAAAFTGADQ